MGSLLVSRRHGRSEAETNSYIDKISAAEDRFDLFVELKAWRKAVEVAAKLRDTYKLNEVRAGRYMLFLLLLFTTYFLSDRAHLPGPGDRAAGAGDPGAPVSGPLCSQDHSCNINTHTQHNLSVTLTLPSCCWPVVWLCSRPLVA